MHDLLKELPQIINLSFDILELIVVRLALLGLAAIGAYALLKRHKTLQRAAKRDAPR